MTGRSWRERSPKSAQGAGCREFEVHVAPSRRFGLRHARQQFGFSPDEAEDLVQDALLRCFRAFPQYDPLRGSFLNWFRRVLDNLCIERLRRARSMPAPCSLDALFLLDEDGDPVQRQVADERHAHAPDQIVMGRHLEEWLVRALEGLAPVYRETLLLSAVEQIDTYAEIAERLSIPVGTVRSRMARARRQLRAAFLQHVHGAMAARNSEESHA